MADTFQRGVSYDQIEFVEDRLGHDWRYSINSSKLRGEGWDHKMGFLRGLTDTIEWYLNNQYFVDVQKRRMNLGG